MGQGWLPAQKAEASSRAPPDHDQVVDVNSSLRWCGGFGLLVGENDKTSSELELELLVESSSSSELDEVSTTFTTSIATSTSSSSSSSELDEGSITTTSISPS